MKILQSRKFEFEGQEYEIRAIADDKGISVAVFLDDERANGYTYRVDHITDYDIKASKGFQGFEHLMDIAESDVKQKYWEQYLDAVRQTGKC